jgi:hypothetical protein
MAPTAKESRGARLDRSGGGGSVSTFSFETVKLIEDGALGGALLNVVGSLVLGLGAAWLGISDLVCNGLVVSRTWTRCESARE